MANNRPSRQGRKSMAELFAVPIAKLPPPPPPVEASPLEQAVWNQVVSAMPAGHFSPESHLLLGRFCFITVWLMAMEQRLRANDFIHDDGETYLGALNLQATIATKLRITLMSRAKYKTLSRKLRNHIPDDASAPWNGAA